ncbi:MAG: hypothetical protein ABR548_00430 [Actinomycetota bacterium]|nr:NERD domain-containing protein [Actinomycetota bacterium]
MKVWEDTAGGGTNGLRSFRAAQIKTASLYLSVIAAGTAGTLGAAEALRHGVGVWAGLVAGVALTTLVGRRAARPVTHHVVRRDGETARALRRLPPTFVILEEIVLPASKKTIEHVIAGTTGVFLVSVRTARQNVRLEQGDLWIDGWRRTDAVSRARRQAEIVARAISLDVVPVLCIEGASAKRHSVDGVRIVSSRALRRLLTRGKSVHTPDDIRRIGDLATSRLVAATR